jgi:predicted RNA-binding Zn-ribbon protein involved in translation (DUF1610 family)
MVDPAPQKKRSFWISVFQRTGQRFACPSCGYAGEFNAFRLNLTGEDCLVRFLCPNCQHELRFDASEEAMVSGHGEMLHPETSFARHWNLVRLRQALFLGLGATLVLIAFGYWQHVDIGRRIASLSARGNSHNTRQGQGLGGTVDLAFPGFQEIGAGYAVKPRSVAREANGVRFKGIVVNEKAFTVDARFRVTQGQASQTFYVENVAPGTGETFDVLLPGATDTSGMVQVEVLETNLRLE